MKRLIVLFLLLSFSYTALACEEKSKKQSVDDVVFNNITPETMDLDRQLQDAYGCKYPFAMVFSSGSYERMRLISGSMAPTPNDGMGKPITGLVLIGFVLNVDGKPIDPVVLKSPDERLSKLALAHVLGLGYKPSKFNSRVVRSLGVQVYDFK